MRRTATDSTSNANQNLATTRQVIIKELKYRYYDVKITFSLKAAPSRPRLTSATEDVEVKKYKFR